MKHFILALDPGNKCGISYGYADDHVVTELLDLTPKSATKSRKAEEKHLRYGVLWNKLAEIYSRWNYEGLTVTLICEGAAGFTKGKSAVEVSNKFRGVCEAFAAVHKINYIGIQPNDLQRWATGKGRAEKSEMMKVADDRYGYKGTDDNCADSLLMYHFAKEQVLR